MVTGNLKLTLGMISQMEFLNRIALRTPLIFFIAAAAAWLSSNFFIKKMPDWKDKSTGLAIYDESGTRIDVSLKSAKNIYFGKRAVFVDARNPDLFAKGHIAKALNVPWSNVEGCVSKVLENVKTDTIIITYCDGMNCGLSKNLALFLIELGYQDVRVLVNGWTAWKEAGLPVETE